MQAVNQIKDLFLTVPEPIRAQLRDRSGAPSLGHAAGMVDDCYACAHAAEDVPLRERVVRRNGWRVAIDFESGLEGWLIVLPARHVLSLDELTPEEAVELGVLLREATIALRAVTGCDKTYVMLFAEKEGFAHLHVHVVPRMPDHPADRRGPDVFAFHRDPAVPAERRDELARELQAAWP